ncbi:MAG: isoprenyl transferase [Pseudomonadota bacterium]
MSDHAHQTLNPAAATAPRHVAIIMDGNGRWAKARGLGRTQGHRKGVEAVRAAVRNAGELGVKYLTLFSFSSENWSRPEQEVSDLMGLLKLFIRRDLAELHREGVRVHIIGERSHLPKDIGPLLEEAENLTANNNALHLIIAFNYGARDEIARATKLIAQKVANGEIRPEDVDDAMVAQHLDTNAFPDPDLIIRTSGEMRLSNFLLYQAAYAEFVFLDCLWPDFDRAEMERAFAIFASRDRRRGGLSSTVAS